MATVTTSRPATPEEMQAEIDRLREGHARMYDEAQQLRDALEDKADVASKALRRAWQLGQTYWQQADSEHWSQNKKAGETQAKFQTLVDETRAAILAEVTPNAALSGPREAGS